MKSKKQQVSLQHRRVPGTAKYWVNFSGWHSEDDMVVDLCDPLQVVPEHSGPYAWKHNRRELGFDIVYKRVREAKLGQFLQKWREQILRIQATQNPSAWKGKLMVRAAVDGKWYRATLVAPFSHQIPSTQNCRAKTRTLEEQSKLKLPVRLTQAFSTQLSALQEQKFTVFCGDVFDQLKTVTQDSLLSIWTQLLATSEGVLRSQQEVDDNEDCKRSRNSDGTSSMDRSNISRCSSSSPTDVATRTDQQLSNKALKQVLRQPDIGFLCALSHNMELPLQDQIAGVLVYRTFPSAPIPFVEILGCVVATMYQPSRLADQLMGIITTRAQGMGYKFLVTCVRNFVLMNDGASYGSTTADSKGTTHGESPKAAIFRALGFKPMSSVNLSRRDQHELNCLSVAETTLQHKQSSYRRSHTGSVPRSTLTSVSPSLLGEGVSLMWSDLQ